MALRDIVNPVSVDYFLAGPDGVLCGNYEKGFYFQKFNSMNEVCQLLSARHDCFDNSNQPEINLFPSMKSLQRFLSSSYVAASSYFDMIQTSQVFSVSTAVSLTKKSFEDFKQKHRDIDLLKDNSSVVAYSLDLHYLLVAESSRTVLNYFSKFYMENVKNTFSSCFAVRCGTDITAANLTKEKLLRNSLPDVRDMVRSCEPYLRIRETVIKCCPN